MTGTIQTLIVLVVRILCIFNLFVGLQLANALAKLRVPTIATKMSSGPKLDYLRR